MKNSFVFYISYREQVALLNMEQRGVLFTALLNHAADTDLPDMDGITSMAFSFIKRQMDMDAQKYAEITEKRRAAGKLGGRPKADASAEKQTEAKKANGFSEKQTKTKKPVDVYVYDNDNVDVDDNNIYSRAEGESDPDDRQKQSQNQERIKAVIDYLNNKCGTRFSIDAEITVNQLEKRFDEGYTEEDFKTVIDKKFNEWHGTEHEKYLRPETLFGSKFDGYLNQKINSRSKTKGTQFNSFDQREYDYSKLGKTLFAR